MGIHQRERMFARKLVTRACAPVNGLAGIGKIRGRMIVFRAAAFARFAGVEFGDGDFLFAALGCFEEGEFEIVTQIRTALRSIAVSNRSVMCNVPIECSKRVCVAPG